MEKEGGPAAGNDEKEFDNSPEMTARPDLAEHRERRDREETRLEGQDTAEISLLAGGKGLLRALAENVGRYPNAKIIFHNDMDGFASSLLAKHLLEAMGFNINVMNIIPISHVDMGKMALGGNFLYLFIDIRPSLPVDEDSGISEIAGNIFCIDHHMTGPDSVFDTPNFFVFCEHSNEEIFPPTATSLVSFLLSVHNDWVDDYADLMKNGPERIPQNIWHLIIQATIADYLHLLSNDIGPNHLKTHTSVEDIDVDQYIKMSIATSLMLGVEGGREEFLIPFYEETLEKIDTRYFLERLVDRLHPVEVIFNFVEYVKRICEKFSAEVRKDIEDEERTLDMQIKKDEEQLELYRQAKVSAEKEGDPSNNEEEMEKERYSQEMGKIENRLNIDRNKLVKLSDNKNMTRLRNLRGLVLFIPRQGNEQTRGILSSLFYYEGFKNLIIEGTEQRSTWSSRGFNREELESFLTTISIDSRKFTDYKLADSAHEKYPGFISKPLVKITTGYSGGMGGRGKIFGGIITGQAVPALENFQENEGAITANLKDIPDSRFWGSAIQAIKDKFFKDDLWISIQMGGGGVSSSILKDDIDILILHLLGRNKTFRLTDRKENDVLSS